MKSDDLLTLADIQDEILLEESKPTHEALCRWCNRFPEHRQSLTEFFARWATQIENKNLPDIDEALVGSRMVSHALNLVHKLRASEQSQTAPSELRLCQMIRLSGTTEDEVMSKCALDESLLAKLDRRLIVFSSIPTTCLERLSGALRRTREEVALALSGEPIALGTYKAKMKPSLKQESFGDAVKNSELSEATKNEWLRLVSSEKTV